MTRIMVADDHPMIRTALEALLRDTDYEIVGTASTVDETLEQLGKVKPEILLLDLQMPGGSGMDVIRKLGANSKDQKIVVLTAAIDDSSLLEALASGVPGMVLKNSDPAFLLECLDRVQRGGTWVDPELTARKEELTESFGDVAHPALAPREKELIRFVRRGMRNREIAQELGVTEGTVKAYLHNVFEKLGVTSRTELAMRADEFLAESYLKG